MKTDDPPAPASAEPADDIDVAAGAIPFHPRSLLFRSLRATLFAGLLSRVIVLGLFVLAGFMKTQPDVYPGHVDVNLAVNVGGIAQVVRQEVSTADVNWTIGIAEQGYEKRPFDADVQRNWAFFPLFPTVLRLASFLTGEFVLTGMALSHFFFLLALFLLHRLCLSFGFTAGDADRCLFYLAFFPASYFFSLPLSEALFLLLTVGSFYLAKRERWWLAGLCGALASATRSNGLLLLPVLALLYWQMYRPFGRGRPWRKDILALLLIPVGLVCFMIYLKLITGNALAFQGAMAAWGRQPGFFLAPLYDYLRDPAVIVAHWNFKLLNFLAAVLALVCGAILLRRGQLVLGLYTLLSVLFSLSSGLLQGQARYAMVAFPICMVLATWGRCANIDRLILAIFVALFALMAALFASHFTLALS